MTRLLHALGRWRGTHCDACGRSVKHDSAISTGRNRLVHLFDRDCAKGGAR